MPTIVNLINDKQEKEQQECIRLQTMTHRRLYCDVNYKDVYN